MPDGSLEPGEAEEASGGVVGQDGAHSKAQHGLKDGQCGGLGREVRQRGVCLLGTPPHRGPGGRQLWPRQSGLLQQAGLQLGLSAAAASCRREGQDLS